MFGPEAKSSFVFQSQDSGLEGKQKLTSLPTEDNNNNNVLFTLNA